MLGVIVECDYCGECETSHISKTPQALRRWLCKNDEWLSVKSGDKGILTFCRKECYENWKLDQTVQTK
jgi:hypothetical protein